MKSGSGSFGAERGFSMLVSVVIPCYNSQESIKHAVELTIAEFRKMPQYTYEFVLVNDYSKDDTYAPSKNLPPNIPV